MRCHRNAPSPRPRGRPTARTRWGEQVSDRNDESSMVQPIGRSILFNLPHLPVFLVAALILLLTPGPAVLYIVARSLDQGRTAGFVSVLSIETGNLVHVLAATLGLSAILMSSALAFSIVKYLGAAYLIYLGLRRLLAREASPSADPHSAPTVATHLSSGCAGSRPQSQDGPVLSGLPAAIRRCVTGRDRPTVFDPRLSVRPHGDRHGRAVCAGRQHRRSIIQTLAHVSAS